VTNAAPKLVTSHGQAQDVATIRGGGGGDEGEWQHAPVAQRDVQAVLDKELRKARRGAHRGGYGVLIPNKVE
jgi:hypothetical protein